nr:IS3 family transposase [Paremcibacter congregatus]
MNEHKPDYPTSVLCRFMKVSRSSYYHWLEVPIGQRAQQDQVLTKDIKDIFKSSRQTYGTRRIKEELILKNKFIGRKRIGRLMKEADLRCKTRRKFRVTTDSNHTHKISPNLLERRFDVDQMNQYWVGDITYVATKKGWLYLATVIDLYSRNVVGWSMATHMRASLVNDAFLMAVWKRKPAHGLVWHTDRGSQYASDSHRAILKDHGVIQSMSRKGNCWDNAVAESFFHTLKTELVHQQQFENQEEANDAIFEYIEVFYNQNRIHSANNYLSPIEYENITKVA